MLELKIAYLLVYMVTLYQKVGEEFLSRLARSKEIDSNKIESLRMLITSGRRIRVQELVNIFTGSHENEVK